MQITYNISAGALVDIRIGDAHLAETLPGLPLCEGDVLLNDRGFTWRAGIAAVANQQAHQLGRWSQTRARLQKEDGTALCVDEWLDSIEAEYGIAEKSGQCVFDGQIVPVRVLALQLPPEQARQAQERLARIAVRKMRQIRASTFKRAGWVILVSTLPACYSASELFWLYRSRWQIERLIKAMKQLLPLVHLRSEQPELIRTTLLAWMLVWSWQEEAVQAIVQQLQRTCGTQDELREEYLQLVRQWGDEEGKLSEQDQPSSVQALPQPTPYLSSLQPALVPPVHGSSLAARCSGCKRSSKANGVGNTCWPLCLASFGFSVPVHAAAVPNASSWKCGCVFVWQSSSVLKFAPMLWGTLCYLSNRDLFVR